jgi:hypothetical protein
LAKHQMTTEELYRWMCDMRGIEEPCKECGGFGVTTYGSTSTWRGGAGGQMLTSGVCDKCWGSGDAHRKWPSHRAAQNNEREVKRLRAMYIDLATD